MRNNVLTPFMFKKSGFILRLCWQSLSGQCFVTRNKSEKNDRWVVSPLIKSCADLALVSRPSIWISARLSTQLCIFATSCWIRGLCKDCSNPGFSAESPSAHYSPRIWSPFRPKFSVFQLASQLAFLNSKPKSALFLWELPCFEKQRNSPFSFFVAPKIGFTLKKSIIHPRCFW